MPGQLRDGQREWKLMRDVEGHRTYKIKFRTVVSPGEGPAAAIQTPGLPLPGALWIVDNDIDVYAWCRFEADVQPVYQVEPCREFDVEFTFSTKPTELRKCQTQQFGDPLLEPQKVSGSSKNHTEEVMYDRFGNPILTSSWELVRGPVVEFEYSTSQVVIEQNVAILNLALCNAMVNTLNDAALWGLPARTIKLSDFTWERKFYGTCNVYYTRRFVFDAKYRITGYGQIESWDRIALDEGAKVLNGRWNPTTGAWTVIAIGGVTPDYLNPSHFIRYKDRQGENARVVLNGFGVPADTQITQGTSGIGLGTGTNSGTPGAIYIERYDQTNFLLLGIPLIF